MLVSLSGSPSRLAVMSAEQFAPRQLRLLKLPVSGVQGLALTPNGRDLVAATGNGAIVLDVAAAERGAVVKRATLSDPSAGAHGGAIQSLVSADGHYAFVTLEFAGKVAVFNLRAALAGHDGFVGEVPLGVSPIGIAESPDGHWLYAASEVAHGLVPTHRSDGALTVIDLRRAERDPSGSIVGSASAGCSPLRLAVSGDGKVVWVSVRDGNALLAFSAESLRSAPARAVLAATRVGPAPVGIAFVAGGRRLVVADSDQFGARGERPGVDVIDPVAALAGRAALVGEIRSGRFPREVSVERSGNTMLVTNFASRQLEAVDLRSLGG